MSSLDRDSGVRTIPQSYCPLCHHKVWYTAAGVRIHLAPNNRCTGAR